MIADAVYTPLLIAGAAMFVAGSALKFFWVKIWPKAEARFTLAANARLARLWNYIDANTGTLFKVKEVRKQAVIETKVEAANVLANPEVVAAPVVATPPLPEKGTEPTPPEEATHVDFNSEQGSDVGEIGAGDGETDSVNGPGSHPEGRGDVPTRSGVNKRFGMPGGATTEEAEAYLGDNRTRAPIITPGPSYRQRKDELEHERAEQLIAMGADENWGVA